MKVGIIGCGALGGSIAQAIRKGKAGDIELFAICDIDAKRLETLYQSLESPSLISTIDTDEIIKNENISLVIEAASQDVVRSLAEKVLKSKKNMMIMSIGALEDKKLLTKLEKLTKVNNVRIFIPSGALSGLDGLKSASIEHIESVELKSTKNPKSLIGQPYLIKNKIDISNLKEPKVVFKGNARKAAQGFPNSANVAVALSLAGIGVENTEVTLIADPNVNKTQHEIFVKGDFGEMYSSVKNILHPENPRTSYLAALSAIRTLRKITEPIQVGT